MRVRLGVTLVSGILALILIAASLVLFIFFGRRWVTDVFFLLVSWLVSAVIVMLVVIIGSFLLGMLVAYRAFTKSEFSPFEEEMLRMRGQLQEVLAEVRELRAAVAPEITKDQAGTSAESASSLEQRRP